MNAKIEPSVTNKEEHSWNATAIYPSSGNEPGAMALGVDIGSTTVKAAVVEAATGEIVWRDYRRHHAHQAQTVLEFLERIEAEVPGVLAGDSRIFVTGSGAQPLADLLGARFVQEVNAIALAVERLYPHANSVIELGGQDAKIVLFRGEVEGRRQAWTSMNDRCAAGTGATIDKCLSKVGISPEDLASLRLEERHLHHVAAKCGVFAEMDVVNLIKSGVPAEDILCSLGDAVVQQNLSVLARGNTLKPNVLLLGGPNVYLPFLQDCWRRRISQTWEERGLELPPGESIESLITVPDQALYCAAYGAVLYGLHETEEGARYRGQQPLRESIESGHRASVLDSTEPPLAADTHEFEQFSLQFALPRFSPPSLKAGSTVRAALGLDGGSTSTKAVLISEDGRVLQKAYRLSKGNPIQDSKEILEELRSHVASQGARLEITGFGVTGYAAGVLDRALCADVDIAETIAHMKSAVALFGDIDVICDIGGQDIKVLFMRNGELQQFKLSNQCSAGNGMLLQATADQFGIPVEEFAEHAFRATLVPRFTAGCAVFLDSNRVTLQREGFKPEELMAGLARVLPKNIWQYIVQVPRLSKLGRRFVLQGGTQYNLAAVKAQVDYLRERVPDVEVFVHPHPGEAGAIGAALEALDVVRKRGHSTFVGLPEAIAVSYTTRTDESTRCSFCTNRCARTFIDTRTPDGTSALYISGASCERGLSEDTEALKAFQRTRRERGRSYPNLAQMEAKRIFAPLKEPEALPSSDTRVYEPAPPVWWRWNRPRVSERSFQRSGAASAAHRKNLRIGMPRCLDFWSSAPFWMAYFQTLGVPARNLVLSQESGERMFTEGAKYGAVDPCYPSKVAQAHLHDLLFHRHSPDRPLNYVFFPTIVQGVGGLPGVPAYACPVVTGTPNVLKAAFTKESDYFAARGIEYIDGAVNLADREILKAQLFVMWGERLRLTRHESDFAIEAGFRALTAFQEDMQEEGKAILENAARTGRYCVLITSRPYHLDDGMNHGVPDLVQALGFPVITLRSIPQDPAWLGPHFEAGPPGAPAPDVMDILDVWPEAHTANTSLKVWGAKFAARHPLVAVLDLSSFKCGHDAPAYGVIDSILERADVPYLTLHDLDANRPTNTLKIRLRTFAYALRRREEAMRVNRASREWRNFEEPEVDATQGGMAEPAPEGALIT